MENEKDYKYVMEDFTTVYLGARMSYQELMEAEFTPHKLRQIIFGIFCKEVEADTTLENHVFYMTKASATYKALVRMKAVVRMSVWVSAGQERRKTSGYVTKEIKIQDLVENAELFRKKDTILVQEVRISKVGMTLVLV